MLYLIRDKETKHLLFETQLADSATVTAEEIFPAFDPATMEMGYWPHGKDSLPDPFVIAENGAVRELSLDEKIERNLIGFGEQLIDYLPAPEAGEEEPVVPTDATQLALVQLALAKNLIRTREDRETALSMLNHEIESRVNRLYPRGAELKLVKECLDWVLAGQPAGDSRHLRYQKMNDDISAIKDQYKTARAEIKKHLSEQNA